MLIESLLRKNFETTPSTIKSLFYEVERWFGNFFFKQNPPEIHSVRLLNLGCGPLIYDGWCNADDYAFKRSLRERGFRPEWRLDITKPWSCKSKFWDGIFSQHCIEHIPYSEAVFVMQECFRTLKPGAWLRISVPSLGKYVEYYNRLQVARDFYYFPHPALAISNMAQMHFHRSVWDEDLMVNVLREIGFQEVRGVKHGEGSDNRLIMDQAEKEWESLYVEARRPVL